MYVSFHSMNGTSAKVTLNGQISLPAALRRRWHTDRVLVIDRGDYALVRPLPVDIIEALRGSVPADGESTEQIRAQEREAESARERDRWSSSTPTP